MNPLFVVCLVHVLVLCQYSWVCYLLLKMSAWGMTVPPWVLVLDQRQGPVGHDPPFAAYLLEIYKAPVPFASFSWAFAPLEASPEYFQEPVEPSFPPLQRKSELFPPDQRVWFLDRLKSRSHHLQKVQLPSDLWRWYLPPSGFPGPD